jgi:Protein of unknown function (DUF559)
MTDAEQHWQRLHRKQINGRQLYRQKPLETYIVDFYCAAQLIVELNGSQHFEEPSKPIPPLKKEEDCFHTMSKNKPITPLFEKGGLKGTCQNTALTTKQMGTGK